MTYLIHYSFYHQLGATTKRFTDKVIIKDTTLQGAKRQVTARAIKEDLQSFKITSAELML